MTARPRARTGMAGGGAGRERALHPYVDVRAAGDEEPILARAWALGAIGSERLEEQGVYRIYFAARDCGAVEQARADLGAAIVDAGALETRDWLEHYRANAEPVEVGRFVLDPREADGTTPESSGFVLRLPARRAFGTGSHATTRLVVSWLDGHPPRGQRVLDVGCGTGVLSFAAARLGAAFVVALDPDLDAAAATVENGARNGVAVAVCQCTVEALAAEAVFDLVLVNVLPENLSGVEPEIASRVAPWGLLVLSGVLSERADEIGHLWLGLGLSLRERHRLEEWTALVFERPGGAGPPAEVGGG